MAGDSSREYAETDIAIVGMAARAPGARNLEELYKNLLAGKEAIRFVDRDEMIELGEDPALVDRPNYVRAFAELPGMEEFDPDFFGLSAKEAAIMDPQHRHFLECAIEALEDAGLVPSRFDGPIGVFAGCGMGSYFRENLMSHRELVEDVGLFLLRHTGNDKDFLSTRLSHLLNLRGPSVNVQTACSTSLVAVHLAAQSLISGECDAALAGGVTIELPHRRGYLYRDGEVLSPDGHCRAFDARAKGTIFGSGAGVVVLKRLEDALANGDRVHAIIKASAINNDGSSKSGYLAPSVEGQAAAILEAQTLAGIEPESIGFIECHGTGTYLGDPIEVEALTQAFRAGTSERGFCYLGSIKTNIGHLDTAAGVLGLIKAALAVRDGVIPATLNFETPNPNIDFERSPFKVADRLMEFPRRGRLRRAAVNSLGVGGTNAHLILEEPPPRRVNEASIEDDETPHYLIISQRNKRALEAQRERLRAFVESEETPSLRDLATTLYRGRELFEESVILSARDHAEAASRLQSNDPRVIRERRRVFDPEPIFLFPGGGAQLPSMGLELSRRDARFAADLREGAAHLSAIGGGNLFAILKNKEALERPSNQLPAILIIEVAMARLMMRRGVQPSLLIGHSMGENAAACVAGVLSFADAIGLVRLRGKLFEEIPRSGMLSVNLSARELAERIGNSLDIAAENAPTLSVASGPLEAIEALEEKLAEEGIEAKRIAIDIAAHSRLLEPLLERFRAHLQTLRLSAPTIPIASNLSGALLSAEEARSPDYWTEHLRRQVRFSACLDLAAKSERSLLIEVGPGRALSSLAAAHGGFDRRVLFTLMPAAGILGESEHLERSLVELYASGCSPQIDDLFKDGAIDRAPSYAFQRRRYFYEVKERAPAHEPAAFTRRAFEEFFERPCFERAAPRLVVGERKRERILLFVEGAELDPLIEGIRARGHELVIARPGERFDEIANGDFRFAPERRDDDMRKLFSLLSARAFYPTRIVHALLIAGEERFRPGSSFFHRNIELGFHSLHALLIALAEADFPCLPQLIALSNGALKIGEEPAPWPEKATALGPILVGPNEIEGLEALLCDLELEERWSFGVRRKLITQGSLESLLDELEAEPASEVLAYRGAHRLRRSRRPMKKPTRSETLLEEGGVYLITGGFSGASFIIARDLAERFQAKLIICTRRALPPMSRWETIRERPILAPEVASILDRIAELEALGAEVAVIESDITYLDTMRDGLRDACARFGPVDGVFHTAGTLRDGLLFDKDLLTIEEVFAPKLDGTLALHSLLRDTPPKFLLLFSSISLELAAAGQIDYIAANAFLNAFARSLDGQRGTRVIALELGMIAALGMAARALGAEIAKTSREVKLSGPLLDRAILEGERVIFEKSLSPSEEFFLDEHRTLEGVAVLPGTAYLAMICAAARELGIEESVQIESVRFLAPMLVKDDEHERLSIIITPEGAHYSVEVLASRGLAEERLLLLARLSGAPSSNLSIDPLRITAYLDERAPKGARLKTGQGENIRFGPHFDVLVARGIRAGEAFAELALHERFIEEVASYALHPALLDLATGFALELAEGYDASDGLWAPMGYESFCAHRNLPAKILSHITLRSESAGEKTASFDILLATEEGEIVAEIKGFTMRQLSGAFEAESIPIAAQPPPADATLLEELKLGVRSEELPAIVEFALRQSAPTELIASPLSIEELRARRAINITRDEAISFERPELDSEYLAPRDEVEAKLAVFFSELLGIAKVGVTDDFFDLGGHSLIAVRFFQRVKKEFGVELGLSLLFEAPTIESIAQHIRPKLDEVARPESHSPASRHIVPIDGGRGQRGTPFFCVAGMFGNILNLRHLGLLLAPDRRVYGIEAKGLREGEQPHESLEEAARDIIVELREIQPEGPYLIGGFSGGGLTAIEIAHILREQGEEVSSLILLDTPPPRGEPVGRIDRAEMLVQDLKRYGPLHLVHRAERRFHWERERLKRAQRSYQEELQEGPRDRLVGEAFLRALEEVELRPYMGPVTLYRPPLPVHYVLRDGTRLNRDRDRLQEDNGWGAWMPNLRVVEVPGDHDSMVLSPNVRVLASRLRAELRSAEYRAPNERRTAE